jgi:hypothetical protein
MRTSKSLPFFVIVLAWFTICAQAQAASSHKSTQANEAEVRQVIERWAKAFRAHDLDGIMSVYAPGDAVIRPCSSSIPNCSLIAERYRHHFLNRGHPSADRHAP